MFPPVVRWVLIVASLLVAMFTWDTNRTSSFLLLAGAAIAAFGYWRYGSVHLAFRAYRAGRIERMERLLRRTRQPELLAASQRVVFEYLSGIAAREHGDFAAARRHFFFATVDRRYNRLRAQSLLELARAEVALGDFDGARGSLAQLRSMGRPGLESSIGEIERSMRDREDA